MSRQVINTGSGVGDPTAETIRSAFTKVNSMTADLFIRGHNVMDSDYGALGNSNYSTGGGADDTVAIQAAYTAAAAVGGYRVVDFPNKVYRLTSTIVVPKGVWSVGHGGHTTAGDNPPTFVWDGADGGVMFDVDDDDLGNIPGTVFSNMYFRAGDMITNKPGTAIRFHGQTSGAAKLETGSYLHDCWFAGFKDDTIKVDGLGATNFLVSGSTRFDGCLGYGFHVNCATGCDFVCGITGQISWQSSGSGKGFMFLDGETATSGGTSIVNIESLHIEVTANLLQTFAAGTNPYDKHGLIRLGVHPASNNVQHRIMVGSFRVNYDGSSTSYSTFQVTATSGTDLEASQCVQITVLQSDNLHYVQVNDAASSGEARLVGGKWPAEQRYPFLGYRSGLIQIGTGKVSAYEGNRQFIYADDFRIRGLSVHPNTFAQLPAVAQAGAIAYVTDSNTVTWGATIAGGGSNKVLAFNNGTNWTVFGK